jgi:hypothetical protein
MDKKADWCLVFFKAPYQGKNLSFFLPATFFLRGNRKRIPFPGLFEMRLSLPKQLKIYMEESMGYMSAFYILKMPFSGTWTISNRFVLPRRKMVSVRLL